MRIACLFVLAGCMLDEPIEPEALPPEIDGTYVDPYNGFCVGAAGGGDWARCNTCALDEARCLIAPACRAIYADDTRTATSERLFRGCFPVADGTALGACETLDAVGCSTRDDCTALHSGVVLIRTPFVACASERVADARLP